jgi:hypothetical protein
VRATGHDVRPLDLQIFSHDDYRHELADFKPQAVGFSLNYLANVPEVIDLKMLWTFARVVNENRQYKDHS